MATLFYAVWNTAAEVANGPVLQEGTVTIGGSSEATATVIDPTGSNRGRRVRLFADSNCFVTWGESPTAMNDGSGGRPMGSENPEYFDIQANHKIAVIQRS